MKQQKQNEIESREHINSKEQYRNKLYGKMENFGMTTEEYQIFLLQGIKKELITIRRHLTEEEEE